MRMEYQIRVESVTLNIFKEQLFETNKEKVPEVEVLASRLALNYQTNAVESDNNDQESQEEKFSVKAQTESFEVSTYS